MVYRRLMSFLLLSVSILLGISCGKKSDTQSEIEQQQEETEEERIQEERIQEERIQAATSIIQDQLKKQRAKIEAAIKEEEKNPFVKIWDSLCKSFKK